MFTGCACVWLVLVYDCLFCVDWCFLLISCLCVNLCVAVVVCCFDLNLDLPMLVLFNSICVGFCISFWFYY